MWKEALMAWKDGGNSQDSQTPGRDLKATPPEYEFGVLSSQQITIKFDEVYGRHTRHTPCTPVVICRSFDYTHNRSRPMRCHG
jgi:hypothetical protein